MHYNATNQIFENAKSLRKELTKSEKILWNELRGRKLKGFKFRRQHPIGTYIADFYCHESKLVIEIDGRIHSEKFQKEYDKSRTYEMKEYGLKVIRFSNEELESSLMDVLREIEKHLS